MKTNSSCCINSQSPCHGIDRGGRCTRPAGQFHGCVLASQDGRLGARGSSLPQWSKESRHAAVKHGRPVESFLNRFEGPAAGLGHIRSQHRDGAESQAAKEKVGAKRRLVEENGRQNRNEPVGKLYMTVSLNDKDSNVTP